MSDSPGTISAEKLAKMTGIPVARLRQISAQGFFSKPERGSYKLAEAVSGLFRYYADASKKLPTYDSIDACCGATGIPKTLLKAAKKNGNAAFRSNRVNLEGVLRWAFSPDSDGAGNWDEKFKEFRSKREQQKFMREDGRTISTDDAESAAAIMIGALNRILRQSLCNDLPAATKGLDEAGIRRKNEAALDRAYDEARSAFKEEVEKAKKEANAEDALAAGPS